MEDAHVAVLDLRSHPGFPSSADTLARAFFGVSSCCPVMEQWRSHPVLGISAKFAWAYLEHQPLSVLWASWTISWESWARSQDLSDLMHRFLMGIVERMQHNLRSGICCPTCSDRRLSSQPQQKPW